MHPDLFLLLKVLPYVGAGLVVLFWLWLVISGWRGDPSRGRARCRKCWHSMEGLPRGNNGWTCPECGRAAARQSDLHRTRRGRWRLRLAMLMLLAAVIAPYGVLVHHRWYLEGLASVVPTSLIAPLFPNEIDDALYGSGFQRWVARTLHIRRDDTWGWQRSLMGTPSIPLEPTPIENAVLLPKAWIEGVPIPVEVRRLWLSDGMLRETATLNGHGVALSTFSEGQPFGPVYGYAMITYGSLPDSDGVLPAMRGTDAHVQLDLEYSFDAGFAPYDYADTQERSIVATIPLVASIEEALDGGVLSPYRDPAIDAYLLGLSYVHARYDPAQGHVWLGASRTDLYRRDPDRRLFDVNIVIEVQIRDGDEVLSRDIYRTRSELDDFEMWPDGLPDRVLGWTKQESAETLDRMTVRLVPRPDLALYEMLHDTYWMPADGSAYLEMPLRRSHDNGAGEDHWLDLFGHEADRLRGNAP